MECLSSMCEELSLTHRTIKSQVFFFYRIGLDIYYLKEKESGGEEKEKKRKGKRQEEGRGDTRTPREDSKRSKIKAKYF